MTRKAECIFCNIVAAQSPCFRIAEDDRTLAFLDIFPVANGHTLIITKDHFDNLFEATPEALEHVVRMSRRVAHAIGAALSPDGLGVFQLNGAAAGQTVFHYHMHLIPRANGEGLTLHGRRRAGESELGAMAERLAAALPAAAE